MEALQEETLVPTVLFRMVDFMTEELKYSFPDVAAHALRRATKRWHANIPRPALAVDKVVAALDDEVDTAFLQFLGEASEKAGMCVVHSCLNSAGRAGRLPVCKAILAAFPRGRDNVFCGYAAEGGHREVLLWARSMNFPWDPAWFAAAKCGNRELIQWMSVREPPGGEDQEDIVLGAARGGHMALLQWALDTGYPFETSESSVACQAAKGGHADMVKWAFARGSPLTTPSFRFDSSSCVALGAAEARDVDLMLWAIEKGCPADFSEIAAIASRNGHLELLQNAIHHRATLTRNCVINAARGGHVHILQLLRDSGAHNMGDGYLEAVYGEKPEVVQWLHDAGCANTKGDLVFSTAARQCKLEIMGMLHALGFPVCKLEVSRTAARLGDRGVLRYLHSTDLLDAAEACISAIESRRAFVVKWLYEDVSPALSQDPRFMRLAAEKGDATILRLLHGKGATWSQASFAKATLAADGCALQFLCSIGCTFDVSHMNMAAYAGNLEAVKWLQANGCRADESTMALIFPRRICRCGVMEVWRWLLANGAPHVGDDNDS